MRLTRAPLVGAITLLLAVACASSGGLRPLSKTLPVALPSVVQRATWERIDGDYDTPSEHVRYALFVDPERPGLFRITQYRVSLRPPGTAGRPRFEDGAEMVVWNEAPETRGPLRCFAEERGAATDRRASAASWRDVSPTTPEFVASMRRAMEIYTRVRREGRAGPPVG